MLIYTLCRILIRLLIMDHYCFPFLKHNQLKNYFYRSPTPLKWTRLWKINYVNFTKDQKKNYGDWNERWCDWISQTYILTPQWIKNLCKKRTLYKDECSGILDFPLSNIESEFKKVWRQRKFRIKMHTTETKEIPG